MEVNVSECAKAPHIFDENWRRTFLNRCFAFRGEQIPILTKAKSMRFLGAPMAARRNLRLKSVNFTLREMEILLGTIMASQLLTV
jgi:hypothetical protein